MNDSIAAINQFNSGSIYGSISTHLYSDKDIEALAITVNDLREEVRQLMIKKLTEDEAIPDTIAIPTVNEHIAKNYKLGRPPMESEIRDAISKTKDMVQASAYLGISVYTLKRYCLYFSEASGGPPLWQPRRGRKAIKPLSLTEEHDTKHPEDVKRAAFGTGSFFNL
jgi:hypothetical protein